MGCSSTKPKGTKHSQPQMFVQSEPQKQLKSKSPAGIPDCAATQLDIMNKNQRDVQPIIVNSKQGIPKHNMLSEQEEFIDVYAQNQFGSPSQNQQLQLRSPNNNSRENTKESSEKQLKTKQVEINQTKKPLEVVAADQYDRNMSEESMVQPVKTIQLHNKSLIEFSSTSVQQSYGGDYRFKQEVGKLNSENANDRVQHKQTHNPFKQNQMKRNQGRSERNEEQKIHLGNKYSRLGDNELKELSNQVTSQQIEMNSQRKKSLLNPKEDIEDDSDDLESQIGRTVSMNRLGQKTKNKQHSFDILSKHMRSILNYQQNYDPLVRTGISMQLIQNDSSDKSSQSVPLAQNAKNNTGRSANTNSNIQTKNFQTVQTIGYFFRTNQEPKKQQSENQQQTTIEQTVLLKKQQQQQLQTEIQQQQKQQQEQQLQWQQKQQQQQEQKIQQLPQQEQQQQKQFQQQQQIKQQQYQEQAKQQQQQKEKPEIQQLKQQDYNNQNNLENQEKLRQQWQNQQLLEQDALKKGQKNLPKVIQPQIQNYTYPTVSK